ncbi:MAG: hypothetical protein JSS50_04795 [Proteobacteria bacterium]|nr:hypothetical protein [Pseudomonadota bacterium]
MQGNKKRDDVLSDWRNGGEYNRFVAKRENPGYTINQKDYTFPEYLLWGASHLSSWFASAGPLNAIDSNSKIARDEARQYMCHLQRTLPDLREIALEEIMALQKQEIALDKALLEHKDAPPILKLFVELAKTPGFDIGVQEQDQDGIWQPCGMLDAVRRVLIGQDKTLDIAVFKEGKLRFNPTDHMVIGLGLSDDNSFQAGVENFLAESRAKQGTNKMEQQALKKKFASVEDSVFSISLMYAAHKQRDTVEGAGAYIDHHIKRLIVEARAELQEVEQSGVYRKQPVNIDPNTANFTSNNPPAVALLGYLAAHNQSADEEVKKAQQAVDLFASSFSNEKFKAHEANKVLNPIADRIINERQAAQEVSKKTWVERMMPAVDLALLRKMHSHARRTVGLGLRNPRKAEMTEWDWFERNTWYAINRMEELVNDIIGGYRQRLRMNDSALIRQTILTSPNQLGGKKDFLDEATKTVAIRAELNTVAGKYPELSQLGINGVGMELHTTHSVTFDQYGMPFKQEDLSFFSMIRSRKLYIEVLEVYAKHLQAQEENASKPVSSPAPATTTAAPSSNSSSSSVSAPAPQAKHTYKEVKEHLDLCKGQLAALELMFSRDDKAIEAFAKRAVYMIPGLLAVAGGVFSAKFVDTKLAKEALDAINDMFKNQWDKLGQGLASGNPALLAMVIGIGLCATGLVFGLWKGAAVAHRIEARTHNYDEGLKYFVTEMHQYLTTEQKNLPEPQSVARN